MTARTIAPTPTGPPATSAPALRPVHPCRSDPDLFFSEDPCDITAAKQTCSTCPFRADCLSYALEHEIYDGVWGGTTGDERLHRATGGSKRCPACEVVQPLGRFHHNARTPGGYATYCKACTKAQDAERNARRKPQRAAYKRAARQRRNRTQEVAA